MNNFIEKQLLSDLNNDLKKRGKDNWNAKIRESEYFETIKQLSPESIKKCTFIWFEDYLKIRHDSWNIEVMRIDFFAYLLQNLEGVEERDLISIVSKLYETDFKVESTWWNVNGFAWLTCLLSHFEKLINGESDLQYYWWNNGAFIEVKYTNATEQIIKADNNDYQVLRYIDVLKRLEEAYTTKSKIAASFSIGSKIKKNASNSGGAFLHLITPYGVTIDEEIKKKAGANNIFLYHSTMEYKETSSFIDKYAFRVKLGELINIDYLSNYHKGVIIRKFADGNGTTGAWDNQ